MRYATENNWEFLEESDLDESSLQVSRIIGFEATVKLMKCLPLTGLYIPKAENINSQSPITNYLSDAEAKELANYYQNTTLILSKIKALKKARNRRLKAEAAVRLPHYQSKTQYYAEIATREELSMVRVRGIISTNN